MKKHWPVVLIFLAFIAINIIYYRNMPGDDLSSSYIACRILAKGEKNHLYSFDPEYFSKIKDPIWIEIAEKTSFRGMMHPYVQTPLWAYILIPLCKAMNFQAFNLLFLVLNFTSIAATVWLVSFQWAPSFLTRPIWLAGFLAVFSLTTPVYYMAFLNQTHPLFLFATILAVFLASRKYNISAGFVLAIAASIKITPAIIAVHWLISGRRKSAFSFLGWSIVLAILTFTIFGEKINLTYLSNLNRISNVLLVSYNNQSLAAWLYGNSYKPVDIFNWRMFSLPTVAKILSLSLMVLVVIYFAIVYQKNRKNLDLVEALSVSSLLIASTIFTSIAWTHYFIILALPLLILINQGSKTKNWWLVIAACIIVILNVWPLAIDPVKPHIYLFTMIRSHFYSGIICLVMLLIISRNSLENPRLESTESNV